MRKIKFRGKNLYDDYVRQEGGDDFTEIKEGCMWLYGGYAEIDGKGYIFPEAKCHQANGDYWTDDDVPDIPIVDKETVGEYTGLKDRNGREIYEGDIVDCPRGTFVIGWGKEHKGFEVWQPCRGKLLFFSDLYSDMALTEDTTEYEPDGCEWEWRVIGNIYDNPELMK